MAKLPPSVARAISKWTLNFELDDLMAAYHGALAALKHSEAEVEPLLRERLGLGPHDDLPDADPDDPNDPLSLIFVQAVERRAQARRGSLVIRKTFLIALFHLWERSGKVRPSQKLGVRDKTNRLLIELEQVANCAKHPKGRSAKAAFRSRPDLFPGAENEVRASERTLVITEATFSEFVGAVRVAAK